MRNEKINTELEKIINAGINKEDVNASPFFATRVMGRIQPEERGDYKRIFNYAFALRVAFVLLIFVNVVNVLLYNTSNVSIENTNTVYNENVISYPVNDFVYSSELLTSNTN